MKVKEAKKITGSMTRTKKMPGLSYSLPAWECITGAKLRKVKGSVCAGCYALKGNYTRYPAIKAAQYYRLARSWLRLKTRHAINVMQTTAGAIDLKRLRMQWPAGSRA